MSGMPHRMPATIEAAAPPYAPAAAPAGFPQPLACSPPPLWPLPTVGLGAPTPGPLAAAGPPLPLHAASARLRLTTRAVVRRRLRFMAGILRPDDRSPIAAINQPIADGGPRSAVARRQPSRRRHRRRTLRPAHCQSRSRRSAAERSHHLRRRPEPAWWGRRRRNRRPGGGRPRVRRWREGEERALAIGHREHSCPYGSDRALSSAEQGGPHGWIGPTARCRSVSEVP